MEYKGKIRESVADHQWVCANGWQSLTHKHEIQTGQPIVSAKMVQKDGTERIHHYCKPCGDKLEAKYQRILETQLKFNL